MSSRGFKGLMEIQALSDDQCRSLVLGNWHKLNQVMRGRPSVVDLRKLLVLELLGSRRPDILRRLRSALSRALGREAEAAMEVVIEAVSADKSPMVEKLLVVGLDRVSAGLVVSDWR